MQPNEQTPPQIPPDPKIPPTQPVRRAIIQPLSSEDDIRQAAASSAAPAQASGSSVDPTNIDVSDTTSTESTERENTCEGGLIAEPIHQSSQAPLQYNTLQSPTPNATAKIKKTFAKVFAVILGALVIGVLGIVAWLYFFNRVPANNLVQESINIFNQESSGDLVQESFDNFTYLRPKEWTSISAGGSGYANAKAEDKQMIALVSVSEFSEDSFMNATSEKDYAEFRTLYMDTIPDNILGGAMIMNAPMGCEPGTFTVTRSENTTKTRTTIGIADVVATCKRDGSPITMKMRIVTGLNDGRSRMIVVAATDLEWLKNDKVFQRMLDSVEERKTT